MSGSLLPRQRGKTAGLLALWDLLNSGAASATLRRPKRTHALFAQHTEQTGQAFTADALDAVWNRTLSQPWLVNALYPEASFGAQGLRRFVGSNPGIAVAVGFAEQTISTFQLLVGTVDGREYSPGERT